jgi:phosphopantothenoylcysteine decarboxylase/phosphopantothenate--cysteine ligase
MKTGWDFSKPNISNLGDHDVFQMRNDLNNKRIALIITGGIAAIKAPFIARMLRRYGADVVVYATKTALNFTTIDALEWSTTNKVITKLTSASEHLSDDNPFDAFLVAPATANIINKMASGIADDAVSTTLASAIGRMEEGTSKVLVAPTLHHTLHSSILTESLSKLDSLGVRIIPPRTENGKHNIPHEKVLVSEVCREVSTSQLKGQSILVTGGPTPTPIDNVRRITNRFRGRLGICITEELYLRGTDVMLIHGDGAYQPPRHLPYMIAKTYDDYLEKVVFELKYGNYKAGVFSAAVADYCPKKISEGKIPSGQNMTLDLVPTQKVIDVVRKNHPDLFMVSFKYQENISLDKLFEIAESRLNKGHNIVVANRGEEVSDSGEQIAYIVRPSEDLHPYFARRRYTGKEQIAKGIVDCLEEIIK